MILRDEREDEVFSCQQAVEGTKHARNRNQEREGGRSKKREKRHPKKPLFPSFLLLLCVSENNYISLQNYISSLKEPRTPSQHGSAFAR